MQAASTNVYRVGPVPFAFLVMRAVSYLYSYPNPWPYKEVSYTASVVVLVLLTCVRGGRFL